MNKERRKQIAKVIDELQGLSVTIESIRDDEQDYFDNMPEGIQSSEKGERAEAATYALDMAYEAIEEAIGQLEEAQE